MRRKLATILVASVAALVASACGGGDGEEKQPAQPTAEKPGEKSKEPARKARSRPAETRSKKPASGGRRSTRRAKRRRKRSAQVQPEQQQRTSPQPAQPQMERVDNTPRVERYLRREFGPGGKREASWYSEVTDVSATNATTTIRTGLADSAVGRRLADEICSSVIGSIPGVTDIVRVTGGPDDKTLAKCVP